MSQNEEILLYLLRPGSRSRGNVWSSAQVLGPYDETHCDKANRQGYCDDLHLHAEMPTPDLNGSEQVHAPFCGDPFVHIHWRWASISNGS